MQNEDGCEYYYDEYSGDGDDNIDDDNYMIMAMMWLLVGGKLL